MQLSDLPTSQDLIRIVQDKTDTILLSFSAGKDSIALWLYLRPYFKIIPFYMYLVPGLRSDQDNLSYYEEFFEQPIMRLPHPLMYSMLNDFVYQPPERVARIRALDLPNFDFANVDEVLAAHFRLDPYYCAVGMRAKDNIDRRNMMIQRGVLGTGRRHFYYGIWDWDVNQVAGILKENNCKIPKFYQIMGRTIIALDYQYLKPFRETYPDDYEVLRSWFPLIDAEFFRYEQVGQVQRG